MRCHYEVLGIERDATAKEIKKGFHLQALRWHPDKHQKNNISPDEATLRFQEIQSAYEVLSDAHERKWYDEHRDQILRGDADGDADDDDEGGDNLNLFKYFSPSVYAGFGSDDKSFYAVYGSLFKKIDDLDIASVVSSSQKPQPAPVFGDKQTSMDDVNYFYQHWASYITQRTFAWVDTYKTTDAPSREIRRAMEKENKKLRDAAKKAFTSEVRELVDFVRRRDQRMLAYKKQKDKEKAQQKKEEEAKRKEKQAAYEAERLAFQQQEQERWEKSETSRHADTEIEAEMDKLRKKMDAALLLCDLCRKTFKSPKQLSNHLSSKKHRDMEMELGIFAGDYNSIEAELELEIQAELAAAKKLKNGGAHANASDEGDEEAASPQALDEEDPSELEKRAKEAEAAAAAEQARLLKDQKAAEKRKERKDQRKQKKKEDVEKLVSGTKGKGGKGKEKAPPPASGKGADKEDDWDSDSDDGRRGSRRKGAKGKKR